MPHGATILAHAFGARYELPIPLLLFVLGGGAVVVLSFAVIARRSVAVGVGVADRSVVTARPALGAGGLLALGALVAIGLLGSQEVSENLLPTVFWLLVWIAVPLSCGLLGDWTRQVNPFATLARLGSRLRRPVLGSEQPLTWPRWLGWWPATGLFFVLAAGELIFNQTATLPRVTAAGLLGYAVLSAFCGLLFGPLWLERGEMFSVLLSTWGRLGYFRFAARGRRGFMGGLDEPFEATPSRVAFVLLLLVSVNVDGLLATPLWSRLQLQLPQSVGPGTAAFQGSLTAGFLLLTLVVAVVFAGFALASARLAEPGRRSALASLTALLPSLVPIALGYLLAHNLEYLVVNAQLLIPLLGNPTGLASWPIHLPAPFNDTFEVHRTLLPSAVYWYISLAVIVTVHVVAVLLAHRHVAGAALDERRARRSEYPWLLAMVGYTMLSLWLLAQPLVLERQ